MNLFRLSPHLKTNSQQLIPNSDGCVRMWTARASSTNVKYVADSLQKLPHPSPASVSSYCSCLCAHTERQKVAGLEVREGGWEWHLGNARWPLQHVSFHASFIHFITSLGRCEGVEKKPCYTETEWEGPHSIFSSPGAAFASAGSPLAWVKSAAVNGGRVEVPCECTVAADGKRTWPRMRDRWVRKAERWEATWPVHFFSSHAFGHGKWRKSSRLRVLLQGCFFVRSVFSRWDTKCYLLHPNSAFLFLCTSIVR